MTYPQQGGNWPDQQWSGGQQPYQDPNQQVYQDPSQQYYDAGQASGAPASPAGYGYPVQQGYQQQGYDYQQQAAYPSYGYGTPVIAAPAPTNGMAIASLVCSLAGILTCGVVSIVGAILGHVARKQIRERGDGGDGMALAGIIVGWVITGLYAAFWIFYLIVIVAVFSTTASYDPSTYPS